MDGVLDGLGDGGDERDAVRGFGRGREDAGAQMRSAGRGREGPRGGVPASERVVAGRGDAVLARAGERAAAEKERDAGGVGIDGDGNGDGVGDVSERGGLRRGALGADGDGGESGGRAARVDGPRAGNQDGRAVLDDVARDGARGGVVQHVRRVAGKRRVAVDGGEGAEAGRAVGERPARAVVERRGDGRTVLLPEGEHRAAEVVVVGPRPGAGGAGEQAREAVALSGRFPIRGEIGLFEGRADVLAALDLAQDRLAVVAEAAVHDERVLQFETGSVGQDRFDGPCRAGRIGERVVANERAGRAVDGVVEDPAEGRADVGFVGKRVPGATDLVNPDAGRITVFVDDFPRVVGGSGGGRRHGDRDAARDRRDGERTSAGVGTGDGADAVFGRVGHVGIGPGEDLEDAGSDGDRIVRTEPEEAGDLPGAGLSERDAEADGREFRAVEFRDRSAVAVAVSGNAGIGRVAVGAVAGGARPQRASGERHRPFRGFVDAVEAGDGRVRGEKPVVGRRDAELDFRRAAADERAVGKAEEHALQFGRVEREGGIGGVTPRDGIETQAPPLVEVRVAAEDEFGGDGDEPDGRWGDGRRRAERRGSGLRRTDPGNAVDAGENVAQDAADEFAAGTGPDVLDAPDAGERERGEFGGGERTAGTARAVDRERDVVAAGRGVDEFAVRKRGRGVREDDFRRVGQEEERLRARDEAGPRRAERKGESVDSGVCVLRGNRQLQGVVPAGGDGPSRMRRSGVHSRTSPSSSQEPPPPAAGFSTEETKCLSHSPESPKSKERDQTTSFETASMPNRGTSRKEAMPFVG